jgi:hypothetical protein
MAVLGIVDEERARKQPRKRHTDWSVVTRMVRIGETPSELRHVLVYHNGDREWVWIPSVMLHIVHNDVTLLRDHTDVVNALHHEFIEFDTKTRQCLLPYDHGHLVVKMNTVSKPM